MRIHKYKLEATDSQVVRMPSPQRFLSFQDREGALCVWYEVNEDADDDEFDDLEFLVLGTGHNLPKRDALYLGTAQQGPFVWHLYVRVR